MHFKNLLAFNFLINVIGLIIIIIIIKQEDLLVGFTTCLTSLQCLKTGDIVIGRVSFKRPFGIIVTLAMLESGCNRDFTDLDIQVFC